MHYYPRFSIFSALAAAILAQLATSLTPPWDEVVVKHATNTVPVEWVSLGNPSARTTIDLHFALQPYHEGALIDALNEVSNPTHHKHVFSCISLRTHVLISAAVLLQIWRTPFKGAGR